MKSTNDPVFVPLLNRLRAAKSILGVPVENCWPNVDENFISSPELATEIQKLCNRPDFKFDLAELRMPYDRIFVEAPMTPEMTALRPAIGEIPIIRLGAFIAALHGVYHFWPVWEFSTGELGFGYAQIIVSADPMPPASWLYEVSPASRPVHFYPMPPTPFIRVAIQKNQPPEVFGKQYNEQVKANPEMVLESLSEVSYLLAAWSALINTKSGVTRTAVQRTAPRGCGKRNKTLRNTKYTLLSLSAVESVGSTGQTTRRRDIDAHYVRGHFKQRTSGIYWWSPHIRGHGQVIHREAYLVTA